MREKALYISSVAIALFAGIAGTVAVVKFMPDNDNIIEKTVSEISITENNTIKSSINKIYDAVVYIENYKGDKLQGTGTGFVYKKDKEKGYIITNHHVIENTNKVIVVTTDGKEVEATLLGSDEYADIAVLSVPLENVLKVAEIGKSTEAELGDTLFTVGSPLGRNYMGTVTKGILSGKDRTVEVSLTNGAFVMDVLQTDAAINPGNSGGPLVDINGQVIGVNSLKLVQDEIEGMGFAIPIEVATSVAEKIEKDGKVIRPLLGVEMIDVTDTWTLYRNNIHVDSSIKQGVVIANVTKGSAADKAGLKAGDVVIEVEEEEIESIAYFRYSLYKHDVGDTIELKINRNNKEKTIKVKLDQSL